MLHSTHIRLRKMEEGDIEKNHQWKNDEEHKHSFMGTSP